jgi:hypothetical protein
MSKANRFNYSQRDPGSHVSLILDLPNPARIKNAKIKRAIEGVETQRAKQKRRVDALAALQKEIRDTEALVAVEAGKALDEQKNVHKEAVARLAELRADEPSAADLVPRSEAKLRAAAGEVLIAWKNERKAWTRDLEQEARDLGVELTSMKLALDRLADGFDSTLGVLAGYARYDADARHRGSIAPHAIQIDLQAASDAMRAALIKLDERGY